MALDFSSQGTLVPDAEPDDDAPDFSAAGVPVEDFSGGGERVAERPGFLKSVGAGIQTGLVSPAGGLVAGAGELVGSESLKQTGKDIISGAKEGVESRMKGAQDWREIKSGSDLYNYVMENFGLNSPQMAAIIGSGLAAQAVIPPVGLPGILAKLGAFGIGAGAAGLGLFTGSNIARQVEEGQEPQPGRAAAFAVPQAAAELMVTRALGLAGADRVFLSVAGPFIKRLATRVGQAMAVGVPAEVAQQALERGAANLPIGDDKAWGEYLDSAVGAAAFLGPAGAISAIPRGKPADAAQVAPAADIPPTPSEGGAEARIEADDAEEARGAQEYTPGYDVDTLTFGVYGPDGKFVKTGFESEERAADAAKTMGEGPLDFSAEGTPEIDTTTVNLEPSEAQKEAGNYAKAHTKIHGLDVAIETPKGAMRRGVGPDGQPWENESPAHYGYIKRTEGADGDQVDVYVGPDQTSQRAFIVDQIDPETGDFDEHKVILGARSIQEAQSIYDAGFSDESGPYRRGSVAEMDIAGLKDWLKGDTKKPVSDPETAYTDVMIPVVERELGVQLTPEQRKTVGVLVRNGMDSTEAVQAVAKQTDIPFQQPVDGERGSAQRLNAWIDAEPTETYTEREAEAVARVQAITNRMFPGAKTQVYKRLFGGKPGDEKQEIYGAAYRTATQRVIALSLASPNLDWSGMHEGIHSLKQIGAFTEGEWNTLSKAAPAWFDKHNIDKRYDGLTQEQKIEEAIAEEFAATRATRFKGVPEAIRKIFQKLDEYLRRIASAARQLFGRDATVEDIFTRVETGDVGRRTAGPFQGEPRFQQFHGSSDADLRLDSSHYSTMNYYGQGFYTTDSTDIAEGYANSKRARRFGQTPTIYEVTPTRDLNILDGEAPLSPEVLTALRRPQDGLILDSLDENPKNLRELYDKIRENGTDEDMSADSIQEIFEIANENLRMIGYDGISHTGGLRTGKPPHKVVIYFNPEQDIKISRRGSSAPSFQTPNPEQPSVAPQGRDYYDATSESIAETIGQNQGTYDRALERMRVKPGMEFKNLNPVEDYTIFPHTLAKMDTPSAKFWNEWKAQDHTASRHLNAFRDTIPTFLDLNEQARDRIYGALELDRIFNRRRPAGSDPIEVHNKGVDFATKTKPGEKYTISDPKEIKAFHEVVALGDRQWDALTAATAKRMGWDGPPKASAVAAAARGARSNAERRQLARLAELLTMMAQQKRRTYMPLMRFGDFFIAVRPKVAADTESLGGFPELQWFETVERAAGDDIMGKSRKPGEMPPGAAERIADLKKRFPNSEIETGDLHRRPELLRSLDIPAVEKLLMLMEAGVKRDLAKQAMQRRQDIETPDDKAGAALKREAKAEAKEDYDRLYDDLIDTFRDVMYAEMKASFKKRAKVTPGYSGDFDRALGTHMHQMANHAASLEHREATERAYQEIQDKHPHKRVRDYWRDWRRFQEDPTTPLGRAANTAGQVGYTWTLAMNPSSTMVNIFDIPQSAIPNLSIGLGMRPAIGHMSRAMGQTYRHAKFDTKQGAHIDLDALLATLPPDEARFIQGLRDEGATQSVGVDDMRALGERQTEAWGKMRSKMRYAMDIAISNMAVMDQANRTSTALAFYRAAKNKDALGKMAEAWSDNQIFRDLVERHGLTPETMGRFGLSEAAYEWGRSNRARVMRGPLGTLAFTLHGYQTRFLSNAFKLMKNMGPEGRIAMAWMAAGLWAGAGIEGLPFSQDLMTIGDAAWKWLTGGQKGHDPMIANRVRQMIHDAGFGKIGAEIVMRGPISTLTGVDLAGRLGFGDVITRQWKGMTDGTGLLGTVPSIIATRIASAVNRYQSNQGLDAAAAELLPAALRNPARAAIVAQDGLKTQKGKTVIPAERISNVDIGKMALGLRPLDQARAYAHREYNYRAPRAHGSVPRNVIPKPGD